MPRNIVLSTRYVLVPPSFLLICWNVSLRAPPHGMCVNHCRRSGHLRGRLAIQTRKGEKNVSCRLKTTHTVRPPSQRNSPPTLHSQPRLHFRHKIASLLSKHRLYSSSLPLVGGTTGLAFGGSHRPAPLAPPTTSPTGRWESKSCAE